MDALDALLVAAAVFLVPQAAVLAINVFTFPVLRPVPARPPRDRVSILVPVRDEAHNLPTTLPRLLRQGAAEVVVLDDGSRDATPAILAELAAANPALRVERGAPLPPGWTGKSWACHQLAELAHGDLFVFTDADVRWEAETLDAVLELRSARDAGLASVWPRQVTGGWFERWVVPGVDLLLLGALPHPAVAATKAPSLAAASGQLMLFTRAAYAQAGGHAGVRAEVLDDVRLAQRAKAAGVRLALALGGDLVSVRMYRTPREVVDGFAKNVGSAVGGSLPALWLLAAANTVAYTLAWPLALLDVRWLAIGALGVTLRLATSLKTGRPATDAVLQPLFPLGLWPIVVRATAWRGGYRWKGRSAP